MAATRAARLKRFGWRGHPHRSLTIERMPTTFGVRGLPVAAKQPRVAEILLAELDDHVLVRCDEETGFRVVHCHARASGNEVEVGFPNLLIAASLLAHRDHPIEEVEGVEAKDKESELDSVVSGQVVHHFYAYATSSGRVQELAETHGRELLARGR